MDSGGSAGVAKQADQSFSFVLRIFENQQANSFFLMGIWGNQKVFGARERREIARSHAIYSDFQSESKSSPRVPVLLVLSAWLCCKPSEAS